MTADIEQIDKACDAFMEARTKLLKAEDLSFRCKLTEAINAADEAVGEVAVGVIALREAIWKKNIDAALAERGAAPSSSEEIYSMRWMSALDAASRIAEQRLTARAS